MKIIILLLLALASSYAFSDNSYFIQRSWTPAAEINMKLPSRFLTYSDTDSIGVGASYVKCTEENGLFYYRFSTPMETGFVITPKYLSGHKNCLKSSNTETADQLKLIEEKLKPLKLTAKSSVNLKYKSLVPKEDCDNSYYFYEDTYINFYPNNKIKSVFYSLSGEHYSTCNK